MIKRKVTVIGGGTGTSVVLQGLKQYQDLALSAVVVVSDNGGSTGRLKDEFGFLPVGDLRQCLAALAKGHNEDDIRELLLYRFTQGEGLKGHNLGNLILMALSDISGSPAKAIETASKIFSISGKVLPVTEQLVDLIITYTDGRVIFGETHLDDKSHGGKKIASVELNHPATIYPGSTEVILESELVIIGPGDLYGSLLPNTCVTGFTDALQQSKGKLVYVVNLMTHYSQTHGMTALDHVEEIKKYCKRSPDFIIINNAPIDQKILNHYKNENEYPVKDDLQNLLEGTVIRRDLVSSIQVKQEEGDSVQRSVLRHDSKKLAETLYQLVAE